MDAHSPPPSPLSPPTHSPIYKHTNHTATAQPVLETYTPIHLPPTLIYTPTDRDRRPVPRSLPHTQHLLSTTVLEGARVAKARTHIHKRTHSHLNMSAWKYPHTHRYIDMGSQSAAHTPTNALLFQQRAHTRAHIHGPTKQILSLHLLLPPPPNACIRNHEDTPQSTPRPDAAPLGCPGRKGLQTRSGGYGARRSTQKSADTPMAHTSLRTHGWGA